MEVHSEKVDNCHWSPHPNPGILDDTCQHAGCSGLDTIRFPVTLWWIPDL